VVDGKWEGKGVVGKGGKEREVTYIHTIAVD